MMNPEDEDYSNVAWDVTGGSNDSTVASISNPLDPDDLNMPSDELYDPLSSLTGSVSKAGISLSDHNDGVLNYGFSVSPVPSLYAHHAREGWLSWRMYAGSGSALEFHGVGLISYFTFPFVTIVNQRPPSNEVLYFSPHIHLCVS